MSNDLLHFPYYLKGTANKQAADIVGASHYADDESERWLRRIERILRNGLPHDDKDVAGTIAHAHAEIELLLESIDPDWWMK